MRAKARVRSVPVLPSRKPEQSTLPNRDQVHSTFESYLGKWKSPKILVVTKTLVAFHVYNKMVPGKSGKVVHIINDSMQYCDNGYRCDGDLRS